MGKCEVYVDEDLKPLIPQYIENRNQDIAKLKKYLEGERFEEIKKLGHSLKGSGGGYGFHFITEVGKGLEEAAEKEAQNKIIDLIREMKNKLDKVEIIYE